MYRAVALARGRTSAEGDRKRSGYNRVRRSNAEASIPDARGGLAADQDGGTSRREDQATNVGDGWRARCNEGAYVHVQ